MSRVRIVWLAIGLIVLAGVGYAGYYFGKDYLAADRSGKPDLDAAPPPRAAVFDTPAEAENATPMAQRVATLGLLNKRNGETRDLEMKPGESRRIGNVVVKLEACERTAPWEPVPETGAFVQLLVEERASARAEPQWRRVFSGWLFKESPSLNLVEHPVYDVWVKNCAMRFPGEEARAKADSPAAPSNAAASPANAANAPDNGDDAAAAAPSPAPAPSAAE
ncbi:MAG: DUF2155 domain-containing protein [Blastomonas sp.]